jgi:hypothetical protein
MFTSACGLAVIFGGNTTSCATVGRVGVDPNGLQQR